MKKILISPPFSNLIEHKNATNILGSFTISPRKGLIKSTLTTIRPYKDGWVNNIGLKNPGIFNIKFRSDVIYSLAAVDKWDWEIFYDYVPSFCKVELNLGCPNVESIKLSPIVHSKFIKKFSMCSVKVPPTSDGYDLALLYRNLVHMGNSLKIPQGGYSGPSNKETVLRYVRQLSEQEIKIIAGGGIRTTQDIEDYLNAGASYCSLSSIFFNPIKAYKVLNAYN